MERQHPLVLSPGVRPSPLSLSVYKSLSSFFLRYGDAAPFGTTIIAYRRTNYPLSQTMGGHNMQVFLATPMRITFECPVSVVLHGDALEWISTPRRLPSAQARHSEKI